jgi:hypothetical protein
MSMVSIHAPNSPKIWRLPHVAMTRVVTLALEMIDILADAQRQAKEAERKYPFLIW